MSSLHANRSHRSSGQLGLQAHLNDDEECWGTVGNAELVPAGWKMMVDRHPQATIYSDPPIGLGWDELKWELPGRLMCSVLC